MIDENPNIEIAIKAKNWPTWFVQVRHASMAWHWPAAALAHALGDEDLERELNAHGNGATAIGFKGSWAAVRKLVAKKNNKGSDINTWD
jgi:hypothetical protein